MTPLAAQLFRHGSVEEQQLLARCQFFDCTRIADMAQEMAAADVHEGGSSYSLMAQLPAPFTALEFTRVNGRALVTAEQHGDDIRYLFWIPDTPTPLMRFTSGFRLGTAENTGLEWATYEGERKLSHLTQAEIDAARGFNNLIEKLLLIINQPGLIDRVPRDADKRVVRGAEKLPGKPDVSKFFECRIRPGQQGEATGDGPEMPLHYVRKHLRPSSGKWVDGYWRGNIELGIHLKWYSASAPTPELR